MMQRRKKSQKENTQQLLSLSRRPENSSQQIIYFDMNKIQREGSRVVTDVTDITASKKKKTPNMADCFSYWCI